MDFRQLTHFVAVAEERSFTRAAARLHVVQSAVSSVVQGLERACGTRLFERSPGGVDLTGAGEVLLPRARAALDALRDAEDALLGATTGLRGTLRIGAMTSIPLQGLPGLLAKFHQQHPGVTIQAGGYPPSASGLASALVERRLDLAFASLPGTPPAGVTLTPLATSPIDLLLPTSHPLAQRGALRLQDLQEATFVDLPQGYGNRDAVDQGFTRAGILRRVLIETTDIGTAIDYIRYGLGVALLPRFLLANVVGLTVVPVNDGLLRWPLAMATAKHRRLGAAAQSMFDLAVQSFRAAEVTEQEATR